MSSRLATEDDLKVGRFDDGRLFKEVLAIEIYVTGSVMELRLYHVDKDS